MTKTLENIYEWIIIVIAIFILVIPEIAYSCLLRARDKLEDMIGELYKLYKFLGTDYKKSIKKDN